MLNQFHIPIEEYFFGIKISNGFLFKDASKERKNDFLLQFPFVSLSKQQCQFDFASRLEPEKNSNKNPHPFLAVKIETIISSETLLP